MSETTAEKSSERTLVDVKDLRVAFASDDGSVNAVNGVDFTLDRGEVLCILGESGSGKSVTMRALMKLLPEKKTTISGDIMVDGHDIIALNGASAALSVSPIPFDGPLGGVRLARPAGPRAPGLLGRVPPEREVAFPTRLRMRAGAESNGKGREFLPGADW